MAEKTKEQIEEETKTGVPPFNYHVAYALVRDFGQFEGVCLDYNEEDDERHIELFKIYLKLLGIKI